MVNTDTPHKPPGVAPSIVRTKAYALDDTQAIEKIMPHLRRVRTTAFLDALFPPTLLPEGKTVDDIYNSLVEQGFITNRRWKGWPERKSRKFKEAAFYTPF
ncbi:hypothetical protein DXG03_006954, partial [Asterophora parasitica]